MSAWRWTAAERVIEHYSDDIPYPSALLLGYVGERPLHVVYADNASDRERIIVTVYEPDPALWAADFSTRKTK